MFHYISGGSLICFALMLSTSVLNFLSYSLLILLLDMLDDWRLVRSSTKEKGGCLSHFMLTYSVAVCFFCVL